MSRIIKMGITSAKMSLADAGVSIPDAIITGTGLGSVEDTEKILGTIHLDQPFLNPTPFIQSTYNTISSQIAILLKCHQYNSTYVHRTFSFESSLQDALLQIDEGTASDILVGGIDEMTMNHLQITRRAGHWKPEPVNNLEMLAWDSPGALAGEGSAFFVVSSRKTDRSYARILEVRTIYKPADPGVLNKRLIDLLSAQSMTPADIDLVILGMNGDNRNDIRYFQFAEENFPGIPQAYYKHLCGEYHTSSAFALWLAANIIKKQLIPPIIRLNSTERKPIRNILVYNQYYNADHSFILVAG
jgi:3-oxoacyl-(acyl-carrier-protein) synthase